MSQQINLFNPIFRKQKKHFSAATMAQSLGVILAGAILLYGYAGLQYVKVKKERAEVAQNLAQAQAQFAKISVLYPPKVSDARIEKEIKSKDAQIKSLQDVFGVLKQGEFGNTSGYSPYFTAFSRQIIPGIWLTGFTIENGGGDMTIEGRTLQPELVPRFLGRLKGEPSLAGKEFAALDMQSPHAEASSADGAAKDSKPPVQPSYVEFVLRGKALQGNEADTLKGKMNALGVNSK